MALAKVNSCGITGIDGYLLDVETDIVRGLPGIDIVGLPDTAIKESKERIKSALKNSDFELPQKRIIINLAPADKKKTGVYLDLPTALAILAASGQIPTECISDYMAVGELALDGTLRHIHGVLPIAITARDLGIKKLLVPKENAA